MLAKVVNRRQGNWEVPLLHMKFANNCERLHGAHPEPGAYEQLAALSHDDIGQSVCLGSPQPRTHLAAERQQRVYKIVRELHVINVLKVQRQTLASRMPCINDLSTPQIDS